MAVTAHRKRVEMQSEGTVKQVNPLLWGRGTHQAEGKKIEGAETRRQGSKECHREGWSMWQPTGEEDVDFTICCHLRET